MKASHLPLPVSPCGRIGLCRTDARLAQPDSAVAQEVVRRARPAAIIATGPGQQCQVSVATRSAGDGNAEEVGGKRTARLYGSTGGLLAWGARAFSDWECAPAPRPRGSQRSSSATGVPCGDMYTSTFPSSSRATTSVGLSWKQRGSRAAFISASRPRSPVPAPACIGPSAPERVRASFGEHRSKVSAGMRNRIPHDLFRVA
jgi:hypothetical protein